MIKILFFVVLCSTSMKSIANDSLTIQELTTKISALETDLKIQKAQVETYDKANDKILNSVYFTIGIILTVVLGLSIWNSISNYRINNTKIENIKTELHFEIEEFSKNLIADKIKIEIDSFKYYTKNQYQDLHNENLDLNIKLLKSFVVTEDLRPGANMETFTLLELLRLSAERYKTDLSYGDQNIITALDALKKYTKKYDKDLQGYERDRIIEEINKIEIPTVKHYIREIKDNLNIKE